jgi:hypothetical protein
MTIRTHQKIRIRCIFLLGGGFLFCAGCSQPLRTLMDLGSEQNAQQSFVRESDARFKVLLRDVKSGRPKTGSTQEQVVARYGQPVLIERNTFLYRSPVGFFDGPKVYLDFDEKKLLIGARINEDVR